MRARQTNRAGPEHAGVLTCSAIDGGHGVTAVFADEMHYLGAVEQAAFPVRGVVRASGKCPSKKRQHFHNNPVGAPSIFGAPTYIATPLPYRNAISCGFWGPSWQEVAKRMGKLPQLLVFHSAVPLRRATGIRARRGQPESDAVRSSLRYSSPGG